MALVVSLTVLTACIDDDFVALSTVLWIHVDLNAATGWEHTGTQGQV